MPATPASQKKNGPTKQTQLDALAMLVEKYKASLNEFEKIEAEILADVMAHTQSNSKEQAREHLHNLLESQ